jgi:hypothetical protein
VLQIVFPDGSDYPCRWRTLGIPPNVFEHIHSCTLRTSPRCPAQRVVKEPLNRPLVSSMCGLFQEPLRGRAFGGATFKSP